MKLILPIPPSVNAAYANCAGRGRVKTKAYRAWIAAADAALLMQKRGIQRVTGPAKMVLSLPANLRGDCDNRIKVASDYLVSRELTSDDRHFVSVTARKAAHVVPGFCEIEVTAE